MTGQPLLYHEIGIGEDPEEELIQYGSSQELVVAEIIHKNFNLFLFRSIAIAGSINDFNNRCPAAVAVGPVGPIDIVGCAVYRGFVLIKGFFMR